jgi:2-keto-3-deoxy-L-rhamnonate aldolase RhmA
MIDSTIVKKNHEGRKAVALGLRFASTELVELAAIAGFDAVHLDGEHGSFTRASVDEICRLANGYGLTVTARVPSIEPWVINMYLDRGVQGIQGAHIESAAQARQLVDACYLPPRGARSWGTGRGTAHHDTVGIQARWGSRRAFADWSNANLHVWAQIESKLGVDNLDQILAVDGLTAIAGGIFDLAA